MVKKFNVNCDFSGKLLPVSLYLGSPAEGTHPLNFQSRWLSQVKNGKIPTDLMKSLSKLAEISQTNRVPFEDLCEYVIKEIEANNSIIEDIKQASALSSKGNSEEENVNSSKNN